MINLQKELLDQNFKSKLLLQVHDELVFDVYKDEVEKIKPLIKEKMEQAIEMVVPLTIEMDIASNWLEAH